MCQEKGKVLVVTDSLEGKQRSFTWLKIKCLGNKGDPKVDLKGISNTVYAKTKHNVRFDWLWLQTWLADNAHVPAEPSKDLIILT